MVGALVLEGSSACSCVAGRHPWLPPHARFSALGLQDAYFLVMRLPSPSTNSLQGKCILKVRFICILSGNKTTTDFRWPLKNAILRDRLASLPEKIFRTLAYGDNISLKATMRSTDEREGRGTDTGSSDVPKSRIIKLPVTEQEVVA